MDVGKMAEMKAVLATLFLTLLPVAFAEELCQSFGGGNVYQEHNRAGGHSIQYSKAISKYTSVINI